MANWKIVYRVVYVSAYVESADSQTCFYLSIFYLTIYLSHQIVFARILVWSFLSEKRGKVGGHEPPLLPLPWHILAFFTSGSREPPLFPLPYHDIWLFRAKLLLYMVYLGPLQGDFKKSNLVTRGRESRVPQIVITATQICFAASALLNW